MQKNAWIRLALIGGLLLAALACSISFGDGEEEDLDLAVQKALIALQQTQTAEAPSGQTAQQNENGGQSSTQEEGNGAEEEEEEITPTITVNPTPCNSPRMTSETIADGTPFDAGDTFTKSWTIRNVGSCSWTPDYQFVFTSGTRMGGASSQNLSRTVNPGDTITMSVNLTAPSSNDAYTGYWKFKTPQGELFGNYWVMIYVGPTPAPFAVTSVVYYMPHTTIDTGCPNDINVKAEITSSAGGNVTYKWRDSTGATSATQSLSFHDPGKKIVDYHVTVTATGDYWAEIYIDNPNHQWFGQKSFHVNCTP